MPAGIVTVTGIVVAAAVWLNVAEGQGADSRLEGPPTAEFHFARLWYNQNSASRRGCNKGVCPSPMLTMFSGWMSG